MKFMLVFCFISAIVYCCYGACFRISPRNGGQNSRYSPCYYRRELIPRGASVTRNCFRCRCGNDGGLTCCSVGANVVSLPDDCKKLISEDGCYERAVRISDERPCTDGVSMVGR